MEESTPHVQCGVIALKTVFDNCPVNKSSVTTFKELPTFTSKLVFEDASGNLAMIVSILIYFITNLVYFMKNWTSYLTRYFETQGKVGVMRGMGAPPADQAVA